MWRLRFGLSIKKTLIKYVILFVLIFPLVSFAQIPQEPTVLQTIYRYADATDTNVLTLVAISKCESGMRQFYDNGKLVVSKTNDAGVFQINIPIHRKKSLEMGFDVYTLSGNIQYAIYLLKQDGIRHWVAATRKCMGKLDFSLLGLPSG